MVVLSLAAGAMGCQGGGSASGQSSGATSNQARPAQRGLDADGRPQPSDADRCAMCGMKVADHRSWAGAIVTGAGKTFYFCGPRCTVATSLHSDRFLGVGRDAIDRIRVTDYLQPEKSLDAKEAFYVVESKVRGPMGLSLLPAATQADAEILVKRHGGRVVRYDDVNDALLMDLKQRSRSAAAPNAPH